MEADNNRTIRPLLERLCRMKQKLPRLMRHLRRISWQATRQAPRDRDVRIYGTGRRIDRTRGHPLRMRTLLLQRVGRIHIAQAPRPDTMQLDDGFAASCARQHARGTSAESVAAWNRIQAAADPSITTPRTGPRNLQRRRATAQRMTSR